MNPTRECPSQETLIDLLYEELDLAEARAVQTHLESCSDCSTVYTELMDFMQLANGLPGGPVVPAHALREKLTRAVATQRSPLLLALAWLKETLTSPIPAYQALLAGAAMAVLFQLGTEKSTPPAATEVAEAPAPVEPPPQIIQRLQPVVVPDAPIHPRHTLRFNDEVVVHATVAEVY